MAKQILLADDSATIQKIVQITFAHEDYAVTGVKGGDEALSRAKQERPDIVLVDVGLPGKSGYEVCAALREAGLRDVPVLMLSSNFHPYDAERGQRAGADGNIVKPFETQAMIDRVAQLLAARAAGVRVAPSAATPSRTEPQAAPVRPEAGHAPVRPEAVAAPGRPEAVAAPGRPEAVAAPGRPEAAHAPGRPEAAPALGRPEAAAVPARPEAAPAAGRPEGVPAPVRPRDAWGESTTVDHSRSPGGSAVPPAMAARHAHPRSTMIGMPVVDPATLTAEDRKAGPPGAARPTGPMAVATQAQARPPGVAGANDRTLVSMEAPKAIGAPQTAPRAPAAPAAPTPAQPPSTPPTSPSATAAGAASAVEPPAAPAHPSSTARPQAPAAPAPRPTGPSSAPAQAPLAAAAATSPSHGGAPPSPATPTAPAAPDERRAAVPIAVEEAPRARAATGNGSEPGRTIPVSAPRMPRPPLIPGMPMPQRRPAGPLVSQAVDETMSRIAARGPEYEAIAKLSREVIEQIAWEIVPELAEVIIRAELAESLQQRPQN